MKLRLFYLMMMPLTSHGYFYSTALGRTYLSMVTGAAVGGVLGWYATQHLIHHPTFQSYLPSNSYSHTASLYVVPVVGGLIGAQLGAEMGIIIRYIHSIKNLPVTR